jgi:hypothetical protein
MAGSEEFCRYKELYHEEKLPVVEASIEDSQGTVVFEKGNSKIKISGSSDDFISAIANLMPTNREGKSRLIDVTTVPVGSTDGYIENLQYFASDFDDPIQDAANRLNREELDVPAELDIREALNASITLDMDNPELKKLVKNFYGSLAVFRSDKLRMRTPYDTYRENVPYDKDRFDAYYDETQALLERNYVLDSAYIGYKKFTQTCETDIKSLAEKLRDFAEQNEAEWAGLRSVDPDLENGKASIRFRENPREDGQHSEEVGSIKGRIGIKRVLNQYAALFELAREPLRDIAATLGAAESIDLNSTAEVLRFLESNEEQYFSDAIEPQLRHGSAHMSMEPDDDTATVKIYDGRGKTRHIKKELNYEEVFQRYYELRDMVGGLVFAFLFVEEGLMYWYMGSEEFQYRIIENADPENF